MSSKYLASFGSLLALCLTSMFPLAALAADTIPQWIWTASHPNSDESREVHFFRGRFTLTGGWKKATLEVSVDNEAVLHLNGQAIGQSKDWQKPLRIDLTKALRQGANVLAIEATNKGGSAGLVSRLTLERWGGPNTVLISNDTWRSSPTLEEGWTKPDFADHHWALAKTVGSLGDGPWGDVFQPRSATRPDKIDVRIDGFQVALIHTAEEGEGSWIAMTTDPQGRLIVSPQSDQQPLLRITLSDQGEVSQIEPIPAPLTQAMGLLYAYDSLYVNGDGPKGS